MKFIFSLLLLASLSTLLSLTSRQQPPHPTMSLKVLDKKYNFAYRQTHGDFYIEKSVADACVSDTCYEEYVVNMHGVKRDAITTAVVERIIIQPKTIIANTNASSTFVGNFIMNDNKHYYEYFIDSGANYKIGNRNPASIRTFPDKHLSAGQYTFILSNDSCFNKRVTILRSNTAVDHAKSFGHRVRIYFRVGMDGMDAQDFTTIFEPTDESITESVEFQVSNNKPCHSLTFYQILSVEQEE